MHKQAAIGALLAAAALSASAADMLGDTLVFTRAYPSAEAQWAGWSPSQVSTTVTADNSDTIFWASGAPLTIDPGAQQIQLTFGSSTSYLTGGSVFDGFRITGFGHDIVSASVFSEGISGTVQLTAGQRLLDLSINGGVRSGQSIVLNVSMVPEPGSWALMLAGGGILVGAARRRRQKAS